MLIAWLSLLLGLGEDRRTHGVSSKRREILLSVIALDRSALNALGARTREPYGRLGGLDNLEGVDAIVVADATGGVGLSDFKLVAHCFLDLCVIGCLVEYA